MTVYSGRFKTLLASISRRVIQKDKGSSSSQHSTLIVVALAIAQCNPSSTFLGWTYLCSRHSTFHLSSLHVTIRGWYRPVMAWYPTCHEYSHDLVIVLNFYNQFLDTVELWIRVGLHTGKWSFWTRYWVACCCMRSRSNEIHPASHTFSVSHTMQHHHIYWHWNENLRKCI